MILRRSVLLLVFLFFCLRYTSLAGTNTIDFDNCFPQNMLNISTPINQTCGVLTAHFSSPLDGYQGGGYSVQNAGTTFWILSQFSGNYLVPNSLNPGGLNIHFSQPIYSIAFTFATADFNQNEIPTTIQLDLYFNSALVRSTQAHGTYGSDTMPMGMLAFDTGGIAANWVDIWIPWQPLGSTDVMVDNIVVTTRDIAAPEPASFALLGGGVLSLAMFIRRRLGL